MVCIASLGFFEAQVQHKDDLRTVETKMRSWLHSWRGAHHRGVSGQQAARGPQMAGHKNILSTVMISIGRSEGFYSCSMLVSIMCDAES